MRLYVDLDSRKLITIPGYSAPLTEVRVRREDILPVEIRFVQDGVVVDPGSTVVEDVYLTVKGKKYYTQATPLVSATSWSKTGAGEDTVFGAVVSFASSAMATVFSLIGGDEFEGMLEVRWANASQTQWGSTNKVPIYIENTLRDSETPTEPSTASGPIFLGTVTTLTGGGANALDGVVTTSVDTPQLYILSIGLSSQLWVLVTATDEENSAGGIVRPDDYDGSTNTKVFKRIG